MDPENKTLSIKPPVWGLVLATIIVIMLTIFLAILTWNQFKQHDYIGRTDQQLYTITIDGEGKVNAIPDIAQVSLGVTTDNLKVADAQKENTTKVNDLMKNLKALGVADKDIQTSNYNIYPKYDYSNGKQNLIGYTVNQSLNVKIRNLDSVGNIIESAGRLGANQVGSLNFTIDDPEIIKQQAREKALVNAKEKADALAKVAGVKLGKLVSFAENSGNAGPIYYDNLKSAAPSGMGGAEMAPVPAIAPGSQDVVVDVTVTYEVL
ncbi:MAG: SIMPL domain-containing protein [Patescibacteria group bacterium]|nr:SIMPL domain-containing protein [Patescibacteria group bacterium]